VHTLLGLSSTLLVILGSYLTFGQLRRLGDWAQRRTVQCFVLAVPVVSLGLGLGGLHHFVGRACLRDAPSWDSLIGLALPVGMGLIALGALVLGVARLALLERVVARRSTPAGPQLQSLADEMAERIGAVRPRLRLCASARPLALTCGLFRPTILLSTWMVEHLDRRELEAVLAHELEHVARRDYLVVWLATMLRDAFFYVPTSWAAYRQLQQEKELACDDLAVGATHRPLAMASALAKVWQHAVGGGQFAQCGTAQHLVGEGESINDRIERLLARPEPTVSRQRTPLGTLAMSLPALVGLLILEAANVVFMLALMECGPALLLGRLF